MMRAMRAETVQEMYSVTEWRTSNIRALSLDQQGTLNIVNCTVVNPQTRAWLAPVWAPLKGYGYYPWEQELSRCSRQP